VKNGEGGRLRHGFWGMNAPGIRISNKKPKIFCRFSTNRDGYAVERDRREGKEGMGGGRKKDLAEGS